MRNCTPEDAFMSLRISIRQKVMILQKSERLYLFVMQQPKRIQQYKIYITIAKRYSKRISCRICSENSDIYSGVNIVVQPTRKYTSGSLASHILGYATKISDSEYQEKGYL